MMFTNVLRLFRGGGCFFFSVLYNCITVELCLFKTIANRKTVAMFRFIKGRLKITHERDMIIIVQCAVSRVASQRYPEII